MSQSSSEHLARMETSYADWSKHRAVLEAYRGAAGGQTNHAAARLQRT